MLASTESRLEARQPQRLAALLPRCLREVPLYRNHSLTAEPGHPPLESLRRLPFITKQDIGRNFPHNFLGLGAQLDALLDEELVELEHTSGTSEHRTPLLLPRGWWAEQERQMLRLNPVAARVLEREPAARRVTINSPACNNDVSYKTVPSRSDRIVGTTLFVSLSKLPFLWSEADLARMAAETSDWEPRFLDVDPVYGVVFARYCERRGIRLPSLQFIVCSYEFLSVTHRRILERAFGVPVLDLYGSTETGHLLIEDEEGWMRPNPENAVLEVIEPDGHGIGELVVTTLTNEFMPLLRYRIGDLVEICERSYGLRYIVHGRVADAFRTPAGRRVNTRQIDQSFAGLAGFAHYQLVGVGPAECLLRYVPDGEGPTDAAKAELNQRLTGLLGPGCVVNFEPTDLLMPENSGKFRLGYPASKKAPQAPSTS